MTSSKPPASKDLPVTVEQVIDHLGRNKEFFVQEKTHELLKSLQIPHLHSGSVSLLEYQILVQRESNQQLSEQLKETLQIVETNIRVSSGLAEVINTVFDVATLQELLGNFAGWWQRIFDQIDEVKLVLPASRDGQRLAKISKNVVVYKPKSIPVEITKSKGFRKHQFGNQISPELMALFTNIKPASYLLLCEPSPQNGALLLGSGSPTRFVQSLNADIALSTSHAFIQRVWDLFEVEKQKENYNQKQTADRQTAAAIKAK